MADVLYCGVRILLVKLIESGSRRVCAVLINAAPNVSLLCLNVYLPYESSNVNTDELEFQLATIADIITRHRCSEVLLSGDFNVDFSRRWAHTLLLNDFSSHLLNIL